MEDAQPDEFLAEARRWAERRNSATTGIATSRANGDTGLPDGSVSLPEQTALAAEPSPRGSYASSVLPGGTIETAGVSNASSAAIAELAATLRDERAARKAAEARCVELERALERYSQQGAELEVGVSQRIITPVNSLFNYCRLN
jgi:hypothetical protein